MALKHCVVIEDHIHPVDISLCKEIIVLTCCHTDFLLILDSLLSVHKIPLTCCNSRPTHLHSVVDVRTVHVASALCCDNDHTVGSTCTIDRCRRCILEDRHALDVRRIDSIKVICRDSNAVKNVKRRCSRVNGVCTTDCERCRSTWLTRVRKYCKTGNLTLKSLVKSSSRSILQLV